MEDKKNIFRGYITVCILHVPVMYFIIIIYGNPWSVFKK